MLTVLGAVLNLYMYYSHNAQQLCELSMIIFFYVSRYGFSRLADFRVTVTAS